MSTTPHLTTPIPTGTWRVDPSASELRFRARGMFGLVPVTGQFTEFNGTLTVDEDQTHGELRIQAASLDTGNAKRDTHLRSADFFDAEQSPVVSFELTGLTPAATSTVTASGVLSIRDTALAIDAPIEVAADSPERLVLSTELDVDRAAAGVGWSKLGMVQGKAHLSARVTLVR